MICCAVLIHSTQIAQTVMTTLAAETIEVKFRRSWKVTYHHGWEGWMTNPFEKMVDETYQDIRSKFILHATLSICCEIAHKNIYNRPDFVIRQV